MDFNFNSSPSDRQIGPVKTPAAIAEPNTTTDTAAIESLLRSTTLSDNSSAEIGDKVRSNTVDKPERDEDVRDRDDANASFDNFAKKEDRMLEIIDYAFTRRRRVGDPRYGGQRLHRWDRKKTLRRRNLRDEKAANSKLA